MKAYSISIKDDPDQGEVIVFGKNIREAKKQYNSTELIWDSYMDIEIHRHSNYDDMENLDSAHLALEQWKSGWRWFDINYPDPDEATDEEFLTWYKSTFE